MKNFKNKNIATSQKTDKVRVRKEADRDLLFAATSKEDILLNKFETTLKGLDEDKVEQALNYFGKNEITSKSKASLTRRLFEAFINPFTAILIGLALVSGFTDIFLAAPGEADPMTVLIILSMVIISGVLRFFQETRSGNATEKLLTMINTTTCVERPDKGKFEIPLEDVVVGDIIHLAAGDLIPADMRILYAKDLFISQSALTGESFTVEKTGQPISSDNSSITELSNIAFMGSSVISGTAYGIVVATGDNTLFGDMAKSVDDKPVKTNFEKGVNSVSWLLIRFMLVMLPVVLFINGFTKGDWVQALLFALSVAVGLTPEMLPMIVTTCLAKGAVAMSKEKTIIKNLNSIQNLGSMDILCTDKTGTLTMDKIVLEYHLNIHSKTDSRVLRHAFLNSYYQTGLRNLLDMAIIEATEKEKRRHPELHDLDRRYEKVDEIPFDFKRRRMSVLVKNGKTQMITKGAVEEMLSICSFAEYEDKVMPLTEEIRSYILKQVNKLNEEGMRVIAVAQKTMLPNVDTFTLEDEKEMVLMGYLAFLDPPKISALPAINALNEHGVDVKVLTGDNDKVSVTVCGQVGIACERILLGKDLDNMDDETLAIEAEHINVFAKLSPSQKARVITVLRGEGHCVGYMGDGINDAAAMNAADVGISVDTAVDIAKESADVILLEKDLMVLEKGILEGRKTYANMMKYIKMTASSNFGNMFSVLVASAFLPFLPMLPIQIIFLNLIYDLSCTALPWDNVDKDYLLKPRKWESSSIGKFMVFIGPTSSVFDITTYALMYFIICPAMCGGLMFHQIEDPATQAYFIALFQTGWFVESMWSQTLVIHMLRTSKTSLLKSFASMPVIILTFSGIAALTIIPFTGFGALIGLTALPPIFFMWLGITIVLYMGLVTFVKRKYVKRWGELI